MVPRRPGADRPAGCGLLESVPAATVPMLAETVLFAVVCAIGFCPREGSRKTHDWTAAPAGAGMFVSFLLRRRGCRGFRGRDEREARGVEPRALVVTNRCSSRRTSR